MRYGCLFILIGLSFPMFSQDKSDFLECLNLIFQHEDFRPAYITDHYRRGNLIIVSGKSSLRADGRVRLRDLKQSLTQDDFYNTSYDVRVYREEELEPLEIPDFAILNVSVSGTENELVIRLSTGNKEENLMCRWVYGLVEENDEWKIAGQSLRKERANFAN